MRKHLAPLLAILLIFVAVYFGTYCATVGQGIVVGHGRWAPFPAYGLGDWIGEDAARQVFAPVHYLDCMVRPGHWRGGSLTDGTMPPKVQGANFY